MQAEIVQAVLDGKDVLAILPTGAGKSICFQIPAVMADGVCIVISPLIALMKDQVMQLKERGIKAEAIYSGMPYRQVDRILDNCVHGDVRILYLSPERLQTDLARERIKRMPVTFVAVDEAHCISQWGHDFRPAYLQIGVMREWHPQVSIVALTATATNAVLEDIAEQLALRSPARFHGGYARDNLSLLIYRREDKLSRLLEIVRKVNGSTIIYVRSRRKTLQLAEALRARRVSAAPYHAGMDHEARSATQDAWLVGRIQVVVCTTAFGMGIDKADVRAVIHYDLPASPEEYYQEAGRAGRDGEPSYCITLYDQSDIHGLTERVDQSFPDYEEIVRVYRALVSYLRLPIGGGKGAVASLDLSAFASSYGMRKPIVFHALKALEKDGWIMLNEAFHHPARVKFRLQKEALYQYQLDQPDRDPLIKAMLRRYEGMFLEPVAIYESTLGSQLQMTKEEVVKHLESMHQDGVVKYTPASSDPQVIMLRERVADNNLEIDKARLQALEKSARLRIDAMLDFLQDQECRTHALLRYFGSKPDRLCGHCDLCRAGSKTIATSTLMGMIGDGGIAIRELIDAFDPEFAVQVRVALRQLESEEKIDVRGMHVYPKQLRDA